jgi:hypothetical protein
MTDQSRPDRRDGWVALGMAVSATSAAVSSFAGLRELAVVAGWPVMLAPMLPLTVDAYAMTATRVWTSESTRSQRARRFARTNAVGAILLSLSGNATYHLIAAGLVAVSWVVVVAVGAVPALVLGLVSHLAVLRTQVDSPGPAQEAVRLRLVPGATPVVPSPAVRPEAGPRYGTEDEWMAAARTADAAYRATHGRAMSRDALRRELRVGGARASTLHRRLKQEREAHLPGA